MSIGSLLGYTESPHHNRYMALSTLDMQLGTLSVKHNQSKGVSLLLD